MNILFQNFKNLHNTLKVSLILSLVLIINISHAQNTVYLEICNDFDSELVNLTIEEGQWEIGEPNKSVFQGSYSGTNSIVTDLVNPYEENQTSVFYFIYQDEEYGGLPNYLGMYSPIEIELHHRFLTNSEDDFGSIEFSYDNGDTWYDLLSDDYSITYDDYKNEHYFESTGVTIYDSLDVYNDSEGWVHSFITKDVDQMFYDSGFNLDSLIFKFSFTSASGTGNDGWQIDDICMKMDTWDTWDGVNNRVESLKVNTFPNPATDHIIFTLNDISDSDIEIYDIYGCLVTELLLNNNEAQWNCQNQASGIYFYQIEIDGHIQSGKIIIKNNN